MTLPPDSPTEAGAPPSERSLKRRELRKQQIIEDAKAGIIKPQSIFDLEYIPRPRARIIPEPVVEPELDPGLEVDEELDDELDEVPQEQLEQAREPEVIVELEPFVALEPEDVSVSEPEPEPQPTPERPIDREPETEPTARSLAVTSKPASKSDTSLLFQRIPERPSSAMAAPAPIAAENVSAIETGRQPRRNRLAVGAAIAVVFGFILTLALPAVDDLPESIASADQVQGLTADDTAQTQIDVESFESVDELEVAAEAATLRANTFTNDPTAAVQYPFDVGVPITDGFGPRNFPVSGFHDAQDFAAGYGAAVRSIAAGTVVESGTTSDGCGFGLKIKHRIDKHDVMSRYCHLAADPVVKVGDKVRPGQFVALVGETGLAFGPHLHFVIQVDGAAVDPMPFLAKYNKPKPLAKKSPSAN